eukprot:Sdes_comp18383_c0_seq1m8199
MNFKPFELSQLPKLAGIETISKCEISSFEQSENHLYIGTQNGHILQYSFDAVYEKSAPLSSAPLRDPLKRYLGLGKTPVQHLLFATGVNRLIAVCDGILCVLNRNTLQIEFSGASSVKYVTNLCADISRREAKSETSFHFCCDRKKEICLYELNEEKLILHRKIPLKETCSHFCWCGPKICIAFSREYSLLNIDSGKFTTLFHFDDTLTHPFVGNIGQAEFLLTVCAVPGVVLGMFVTNRGDTARAPLTWTDSPVSVVFQYPYVLSLLRCFTKIQIHNVNDQQLKQALSWNDSATTLNPNPRCESGLVKLGFQNRILACDSTKMFLVLPTSLLDQVRDLLLDQTKSKIEEALSLVEESQIGCDSEEKNRLLARAKQMAGFAYLKMNFYTLSMSCFLQGNLDPRELICLFKDLQISGFDSIHSSPVVSASLPPPLHPYSNAEEFFGYDGEQILQGKLFLLNFLEKVRLCESHSEDTRQYVDSVLLELYCCGDFSEEKQRENRVYLQKLVSGKNYCLFWECKAIMEDCGRHHCLALFCQSCGKHLEALEIWEKLAKKVLLDDDFVSYEAPLFCLKDLQEKP